MICPNCGKELPDGTKFCPECGAKLTNEIAPPALKAPCEPAEVARPLLGDQLMKLERNRFVNIYSTPAVLLAFVFLVVALFRLKMAAMSEIALALSIISFIYVVSVVVYGMYAQLKIKPEHAKKSFDFTVYMRGYGRWNIAIYIVVVLMVLILIMQLPQCIISMADSKTFTQEAVAEFGPECRNRVIYIIVAAVFLAVQMVGILVVTKKKSLSYDKRKICLTLYGVETPDAEQKLIMPEEELSAEIEKMYAYCRYKRQKTEYVYEKSLYERGKNYQNKPPFAVIWAYLHKLFVIVAAAAAAVVIILCCVLPPALSNPFRYGSVKRVSPGDELYWTYAILGEPDIDPETDSFGEGSWYSSNVKKYFTNPENFSLDIPEYQYIEIDYYLGKLSGGEDRLMVESIRFDNKATLLGGEKTVKSVKLSSDSVNEQRDGEGKISYQGKQIYAQIRYTDGSYAAYFMPANTRIQKSATGANGGTIEWFDEWGDYSCNVKVF